MIALNSKEISRVTHNKMQEPIKSMVFLYIYCNGKNKLNVSLIQYENRDSVSSAIALCMLKMQNKLSD